MKRYHSFTSRLGDDDMFSNDLTDEEMFSKLGNILPGIPVMIVFSMDDEYVPPQVDKLALTDKMKRVLMQKRDNNSNSNNDSENKNREVDMLLIEGANHGLGNHPQATLQFTEGVARFFAKYY